MTMPQNGILMLVTNLSKPNSSMSLSHTAQLSELVSWSQSSCNGSTTTMRKTPTRGSSPQRNLQELHSRHCIQALIMSSTSNTLEFLILFSLLSCMEWACLCCSQLPASVSLPNGQMKDSMLHMFSSYHQLLMKDWPKMVSMSLDGLHSSSFSMPIGCWATSRFLLTNGPILTMLVNRWDPNISSLLKWTRQLR